MAAAEDLERQVERLVDRLAGATPVWYAARPRGAVRAEVLRGLVRTLAELGRRAGTGVPEGIVPPVLGDHALGAQLTLLAHELATAPEDLTDEGAAAVRTARDLL